MEPKDTNFSDKYQFSFFDAPITNVKPRIEPFTLKRVYKGIKSPIAKAATDAIRKQRNKSGRDAIKEKTLPVVTFAGIFKNRNSKSLERRSGLIVIDLDHIEYLKAIRDNILTHNQPALMFTSPSGDGLKVVYAIDPDQGEHLDYFHAIQEFFKTIIGVEIDKSGKDICRACYLCHDKDAFYCETPDILNKYFIDTYLHQKPIKDPVFSRGMSSEEVFKCAKDRTDETENFIDGNRNHYITILAGFCHRMGLSEDFTLDHLNNYQQPDQDFPLSKIKKTVASIFSNQAYKGTAIPETKSFHYFSFPLRFLWFDSNPTLEEIKKRLSEIIDWYIIKYSLTEKCGEKHDGERYEEAQRQLEYRCESTHQEAYANYLLLSKKDVAPHIPTSIRMDIFLDSLSGTLEYDLLLLLAAVKSVIGFNRNFTKAYREFLTERMYGTPDKINRYRFDILMNRATDRKLFLKIPDKRGFFVSISYRTIEEFEKQITLRIEKFYNSKIAVKKASGNLFHVRQTKREELKNLNRNDFST